MPLTITFPVFFTLSYVTVLMVKDAEKPLQLLQLFMSKKTEKSQSLTSHPKCSGCQRAALGL